MEFQEYPKALYKGGDVAGDWVMVHDKKEEAAKRKAGFSMLGEEAKQPANQPPQGEPQNGPAAE